MADDHYLAKTYAEARSRLALDYTYGFDTSGQSQEWYLGDIIVNGWASEDDIKHFTHHSLMRGYEEWHLMFSCANALKELKEEASFDDPLEGQDLLTFLTKVLSPRSGPLDGVISGKTSNLHPKYEDVAQEPQSQSSTKQGKAGKRKRDASHEQTDPEQSVKKHGMNMISPFWSANNPGSSLQQFHQSADDKKESKSEKKKSRKNSKKRKRDIKARKSLPESIATPLAESPVLRVPKVRRSQDNISTSPEFYSRESVSGQGGVLHTTLPLRVSHTNTEAEKVLADLQSSLPTPGNVEGTLDAATLSLGESDENEEPEINGAASHKRESKSPQLVVKCLTPKRKTKSPYFDTMDMFGPPKIKYPRPPRGTVPCVPFPRLDAPNFGLIQEDLATDPLRLLIAVTFLIRVKGKHSIPVFHDLVEKYPTPRHLAEADTNDIIAMIKHLGLSAVRATAIQKYARIWIEKPPRADIRYGVKNYPQLGDGADVRTAETLSPDDPRSSAWEIGHMTQGRYAIDSWRIFCRDVLLGRAEDWRGKGREGEFQPEWMRVLPEDKELRACLRWLWMQEGYVWDPKTGEKDILPEDLRRAVNEGRVAYDDTGELKILDKVAPTGSSTLKCI
ncbi:DNA glycosylase [Daldinia decipiens]|uniref:DNA glycosylase n=1 Tax=Daldinia decipiens TaxID=326647 RepID=UPI0020C5350F|nr:DNA glycosylase [Daldinia decipiens]KAI1657838.1 DNA glycosylase [Daldinia decipiens]